MLVSKKKYKFNKSGINRLVDMSEYSYDKNFNLVKRLDFNSKKEKLAELRLYYDSRQCKSKEEYYNGADKLEGIKRF